MGNPYYNTPNNNSAGLNNKKGMNNSQDINKPFINNAPAITSQNPYIKQGISASEILTGALIGAAATYILTNENVQKTLFKGALSVSAILSGGLDEMKERFLDAQAEFEAAKEA